MYVSGELIDSCVLELNSVFCIVTNWCYYLTIANPSKKKKNNLHRESIL